MTSSSTSELSRTEVPPALTARRVVPAVVSRRESQPSRAAYLDNLKVALVAGVIMDHAAGFYLGGGYGFVQPGMSYSAAAVLWIAFGFGTMFAMGTFFFMAGSLTPASLTRKGPRTYLGDRLLRLGVPLVASIWLISPICWFGGTLAASGDLGNAWKAAENSLVNPDPGVAWFLTVLLLFSALFVAYRTWRPGLRGVHEGLRVRYVLLAAALIAATTFPVRLLFLAGSNQALGLHIWQWPQYLTLFFLGAFAAERGWLDHLSRGLKIALGLAVGGAGLAMTAGLFASGTGVNFEPFRGGWHWQAACLAISEGALSVSLTVILIGLFRRYLNRQGLLFRAMSKDAYAAFIIQSPVLVAGALLLRDMPLPGELKFIILAVAAVAGSFAAAHALRSVAVIRRIAKSPKPSPERWMPE